LECFVAGFSRMWQVKDGAWKGHNSCYAYVEAGGDLRQCSGTWYSCDSVGVPPLAQPILILVDSAAEQVSGAVHACLFHPLLCLCMPCPVCASRLDPAPGRCRAATTSRCVSCRSCAPFDCHACTQPLTRQDEPQSEAFERCYRRRLPTRQSICRGICHN